MTRIAKTKSRKFAPVFGLAILGLALVGPGGPASAAAPAQGIAGDVRCLMLSNVFAKSATEASAREIAAQSLLFYLGRINGRADARTITNAMRANAHVNQQAASAEMRTCAGALAQAQVNLQAWGRAA